MGIFCCKVFATLRTLEHPILTVRKHSCAGDSWRQYCEKQLLAHLHALDPGSVVCESTRSLAH